LVIAGLEATTLAYAWAAIFVGGFIRGYTGFGSSMIWVSSLTQVMPAARVVPVILALEVLASAHLLPGAWPAVQWTTVWPLMLAAWLATPIGVWILARLSPAAMQLAISLVVLATAGLLWRGYTLRRMPGTPATLAIGAVSGVLTGSTSAGGPPLVMFYLSSPAGMAVQRASLIACFLGIDAVGVGIAALAGLVPAESVVLVALLLPAMLVGTALGDRRFLGTTPETFRRVALLLLAALGLAGILRALL
jgi:uncharacterized membrane protein YfcA